jgi:hypothetical protein
MLDWVHLSRSHLSRRAKAGMYANTCWGLLGFTVTFSLAVLGLPARYEWLAPWFIGAAVASGVGSLICFAWPLRERANRAKVAALIVHPIRALRLIEPSHIIILGLLIALVGVVWQMRRSPPIEAATAASASSLPSPASPQVKARTHPYDVPKKLKTIDEDILPLLQNDMERLTNRSSQLQSNWRSFLTHDRTKYMAQLREHRMEWESLAQRIGQIQRDNQNYDDIYALLNQDYQKIYTDSFSRFQGAIGSIGDPPYTMDLNFFIEPISEQFAESIKAMAIWRGQTATKFAQLRKDIAEGQ